MKDKEFIVKKDGMYAKETDYEYFRPTSRQGATRFNEEDADKCVEFLRGDAEKEEVE